MKTDFFCDTVEPTAWKRLGPGLAGLHLDAALNKRTIVQILKLILADDEQKLREIETKLSTLRAKIAKHAGAV